MVTWTFGLINRLVRLGDVAALLLASGFASLIAWPAPLPLTVLQGVFTLALGLGIYLRAMSAMNAYRVEHYRSIRRSIIEPIAGFLLAALTVLIIFLVFVPPVLALTDALLFRAALCLAGLLGLRIFARFAIAAVFRRGLLRRRVAIIGASDRSGQIIDDLSHAEHQMAFEVVGIYDDRGPDRRPESVNNIAVAGTVDDLRRVAAQGKIDMVVVALPWMAALRIHSMLEKLQGFSADVVIPFENEDFRLNFSNVIRVGGMPALQVAHRPLKGTQGLFKTAEDYLVASIGVLLVSPILVAAAIAIRLTSPGPILFRQTRVGFNNQTFQVYKFRTMTVDPTDDGTVGTAKDNPRITRIGAFLRRSSIDELPQLFNVFKGEMSVVGPRPHVPNMLVGDHAYFDAVRQYAYRCRVKPGITGWAQINGARGGMHSIEKAKKAVLFDIFYIENWSLWFDIKIMAQTVLTGLFGRDVF
ncbi:undecaprenyl-phosphate glucose phosphotransferase [Oleomonas cavernae]|uniref:Undecaprenyl-phosphate glucose phosphotransferase n=1 Tax=Oleomonas cavernae TaxID=2320859 RepID=A0A418WGX4_9PROT|nr:undecaprenyl-phosphate glucose phosphotransferase [Oleomonas cavernae]RJF89119.1 undecaprenyl-phosphate glucose phosphotransferase [Oleomonas cavernae]